MYEHAHVINTMNPWIWQYANVINMSIIRDHVYDKYRMNPRISQICEYEYNQCWEW